MHLFTDIPFLMSMTFTLTIFTILVDWLIDWLLFNANSAISWREQVNFQWDDDEVRFVLDQHNEVDFLLVLAHWTNSPRIYMSPYSDTLSWFRDNHSLLFLLNAAWLVEKQQIPIIKYWSDRGSNPRYTALEASTLTSTPPMHFNVCRISNQRIQSLPQSRQNVSYKRPFLRQLFSNKQIKFVARVD
jgi:hypothetical protein